MKKYIYFMVISASLLFVSCSKSYFDINKNPNAATESSVTPYLILPTALHNTGTLTGANYNALARYMGAWTRGGDFGPNQEEESYQLTTNFANTGFSFASWYDNLFDYSIIEKQGTATGQNFYVAIAKTMKTVGFMNLVDMFNNVPYSQAFDLSANILPKYDKGRDIYTDLFKQLDQALALLNSVVPNKDENITTADIMFKGNVTMWKKFINTQRLKLVLRVATNASLVTPATELAKVTSDGFLGTGETAAVNPGYAKANNTGGLSQQNPFWDSYKENVSGVPFDNFNRANNFVLNILKGSGDIRFEYYFAKAITPLLGNLYAGMPYGYPSVAGLPSSNNTSGVGGVGLAKSFSQGQWILTSVESKFLQAEAIQRGWLSGTAQAAFEDAVRESHIWLGVTNAVATANAYLAGGSTYVNLAGSTNKIATIMIQKYLSMVGMNNFEPWSDYRRISTGLATDAGDGLALYNFYLPAKSINASAAANVIPRRYRYPQREYNFNAASVGAEGNPDPQTSKIFWAK
jgi:Starch-binding associating with outer membrane